MALEIRFLIFESFNIILYIFFTGSYETEKPLLSINLLTHEKVALGIRFLIFESFEVILYIFFTGSYETEKPASS